MKLALILSCLLGLLGLGCGSRSVSYTGDSGVHGNSNNNNGGGTGHCTEPDDCVIAYWADQCCSCPQPASREAVESEPCLVSIYQSYIPPECVVECPAVDCPPCVPWDGEVTCGGGECIWNEGGCTGDSDCLLVIRVDECCTQAHAMSRNDIGTDPCLVYWPPTEISDTCRARWDQNCDWINCTWSGPPTRNAVCGAGACELTTECSDSLDCGLALNGRECCPCPEAWPAGMIGRDPCLVPSGTPVPLDCPMHECLADCGPCPTFSIADCEQQTCTTVYGNQ